MVVIPLLVMEEMPGREAGSVCVYVCNVGVRGRRVQKAIPWYVKLSLRQHQVHEVKPFHNNARHYFPFPLLFLKKECLVEFSRSYMSCDNTIDLMPN